MMFKAIQINTIREELRFSLRHPRVRSSLLLLGLAAVVFVINGVFYWRPAWQADTALRAAIDSKRREIVNADFNLRLAQVSRRAAEHVAQVEKKFDAAATQASVVQSLAALARRHHARILAEAYEEGKPRDGYTPLMHELTVEAGYADLRAFAVDLQSVSSFTVMQEAVLARSAGSPTVKAQLRMVTFRRTPGRS